MLLDRGLDLVRIHLEAAPIYHQLLATRNRKVPSCVLGSQIPGKVRAASEAFTSRGLVVQVARGGKRARDRELFLQAGSQGLSLLVQHLHAHTRYRGSNGFNARFEGGIPIEADASRFGRTVQLPHGDAVARVKLPAVRGEQRGAGGEDDAQGREIHFGPRRRLAQDREDLRHSPEERDSLARDEIEDFPALELLHRIKRRARVHGGHHGTHQTIYMGERSHAEKTIGLASLEHDAQGFQFEMEGRVRPHNPLGGARRPRRILLKEGGGVGGPYWTPSARTRLKQSCVLAERDFDEGRWALESGQDRSYLRHESGVRQRRDGVEVIQVVHELLRPILCAQRGHDATEPCDRKERRNERRRIGQQQGDTLPWRPKGRLECPRECLRPTEQVSKRYFAIALADGYSSSLSGPSAVQRIRKHQLAGHLESRSPMNAASDPTVSRWRISSSLSSMVSPNASSTALITCSISMESSPIPPPMSTVSSPISSLGVITPEPLVITSNRRRSTAG